MATTADTLVKRVRRFVDDYPDLDATTASISSGSTSLTVADTTVLYNANRQPLELDQELVYVTALAGGTTLTVRRGMQGTTAASHASGISVIVNPRFTYQTILDALNAALDACWPMIYQPIVDESLSTSASTYEYTVPTVASTSQPIPYIEWVKLMEPGDVIFRRVDQWTILRGDTPKIVFGYEPPPVSTIRIKGIAPLGHLATAASTLPNSFPYQAEDAVVQFAGSYLTLSGEVSRVRVDTGMIDNREQAVRTGASAAVSNALYQRFYQRLAAVAMPPPGKHLKPVLG